MGHAPFAYWLVSALRPKTLVELGSHWGDSYFAMCSSVRDNQTETKCYAVDTWQGDKHAGFYGDAVFETVSQHNDANFKDFSTLVRADFTEAAADFADGSLDLIHIDGLHTYEAVKHDVETWLPKLAPDGVMMLHDTHEKRTDFGVYRLWEELMAKYPNHLDFSHSHGLGVFSIGEKHELESMTSSYWGPNWKTIIESLGFYSREISSQKGGFRNLEAQLREETKTSTNSLESQLQESLANLKQLSDRLSIVEAQSLETNLANQQLSREIGDLEAKNSETNLANQQLSREIANLELQRKLDAENFLERLVATQENLDKAESSIRDLLSSKSWRITSPLRRGAAFIGFGKGK